MTATVSRAHPLALLTALLLASGQACMVASAADNDVLIRNAMVFDATGRAPYAASVLVQDGRIAAIGTGLKAPAHTRQVDAKGQALLPGLFDLHTHWTPNAEPSTLPQIATRYLDAGVTTVSDFHQPPEA
jgi:N-acyl-D-aspartate/D-glutamate deacylase